MQSRSFSVPPGRAGERVDVAVATLLGLSRTHAAEIADSGGVSLDGRTVGKSDRVVADGWLEIAWQPRREVSIEPIPVENLGIVYDDDDYVVVDKPIGVAAHPAHGWLGPTVIGALAAAGYRIATSGPAERAGIVHRLDAGTSGLMVVAKSETAYRELKRQFHDREVEKIYHAVVQGHLDPLSGTIDAPIARHPGSAWKFAVVAGGKASVTHYDTIEAFRSASLLEIHLETGRTHQIRVHMAAQRHPCVGDSMYGADPTLSARLGLERQWLHAMRLAFRHPGTGQWSEYSSIYPADLTQALQALRAA